jgi:hypothetical protein
MSILGKVPVQICCRQLKDYVASNEKYWVSFGGFKSIYVQAHGMLP